VLDIQIILALSCPHSGQGRVKDAGSVQQHGTGSSTVDCANESLGRQLAIVVGNQSQARDIASRGARWITCGNDIDKGDLCAVAHGGRRGGIVQLDVPVGQVGLEKVKEMLAHGDIAVGA
jgi:hypothetical protein